MCSSLNLLQAGRSLSAASPRTSAMPRDVGGRAKRMLNSIISHARDRLVGGRQWSPDSDNKILELAEAERAAMVTVRQEGVFHLLHNAGTTHVVYKANGSWVSLSRRRRQHEAVDQFNLLSDHADLFSYTSSRSSMQKLIATIMLHPLWNSAHIAAAVDIKQYFEWAEQTGVLQQLNCPCRPEGWYPVHIAIKHQHGDLLKYMIDRLKFSIKEKDKDGYNALHHAATVNATMVKIVLSHVDGRSCLNTLNRDGFTPLLLSVTSGKPSCVAMLVKEGAVLNVAGTGRTVLHQAMLQKSNKSAAIIKTMANMSPSLLGVVDQESGDRAAHVASNKNNMLALLDGSHEPVDLDARNAVGQTALHVHTANNNLGCVMVLIYNKANLDARDQGGNTALHIAVLNQNDTICKALLLFGASTNMVNGDGESCRHLAAKIASGNAAASKFVHWLAMFGARPCQFDRHEQHQHYRLCSLPPAASDRGAVDEHQAQQCLDEFRQQQCIEYVKQQAAVGRSMDVLLTLDGGGVRGVMMVQVLLMVQRKLTVPLRKMIQWVAGTSTGAILAVAFVTGQNLSDVMRIYFKLKDDIFEGHSRPYSAERLEQCLQQLFGTSTRLTDIKEPKLIITSVLAECHPVRLEIFRNYQLSTEVPVNSECKYIDCAAIPLWKVLRCTSAAPSYFTSVDNKYVDGGLIANNPTLDALSEISRYNVAQQYTGRGKMQVGCVLNLGTGRIPQEPIATLNMNTSNPLQLLPAVQAFALLVMNQMTAGDGRPAERSRSWCHDLNIPYFRFSPPLSKHYTLDTKNDQDVINMMWEMHEYLLANESQVDCLVSLLSCITAGRPTETTAELVSQ